MLQVASALVVQQSLVPDEGSEQIGSVNRVTSHFALFADVVLGVVSFRLCGFT